MSQSKNSTLREQRDCFTQYTQIRHWFPYPLPCIFIFINCLIEASFMILHCQRKKMCSCSCRTRNFFRYFFTPPVQCGHYYFVHLARQFWLYQIGYPKNLSIYQFAKTNNLIRSWDMTFVYNLISGFWNFIIQRLMTPERNQIEKQEPANLALRLPGYLLKCFFNWSLWNIALNAEHVNCKLEETLVRRWQTRCSLKRIPVY